MERSHEMHIGISKAVQEEHSGHEQCDFVCSFSTGPYIAMGQGMGGSCPPRAVPLKFYSVAIICGSQHALR